MANVMSPELRQGRVSTSSKKGQLKVQETYHCFITTDDPYASRASILNTPGLPTPYVDVSPTLMGLCTTVDCERDPKRATLWHITINYSSDVEDSSGSQGNPNSDPLTWVPIRETYLEPYEEVLIRDLDGKEFVNGAGMPFDNAPAVSKDNLRWDFFQFEPLSVTDNTIKARNNAINKEPFRDCAKHTLKLKVRRSVLGYYFGRNLRLSEYSLIWKESNWHEKIANYGETFRHNNMVWPYIYKDDPNTVHKGPLGIKDYLYGETMDARGGLPTGDNSATVGNCVDTSVTSVVYAKPPTNPKLYFIERRVCNLLEFNGILRVI